MQTEKVRKTINRFQKISTAVFMIIMVLVCICSCLLYKKQPGYPFNLWGIFYTATGFIFMEENNRPVNRPLSVALHCVGLLLAASGLCCWFLVN